MVVSDEYAGALYKSRKACYGLDKTANMTDEPRFAYRQCLWCGKPVARRYWRYDNKNGELCPWCERRTLPSETKGFEPPPLQGFEGRYGPAHEHLDKTANQCGTTLVEKEGK